MSTRSTRLLPCAAPYAVAASMVVTGVLLASSPAQAIVGGVDATRAYASTVMVHLRGDDGVFRQRCAGMVISHEGHIGVQTNAICVTAPGSSQPFPADQIRITVGSADRIHGRRQIAVTYAGVGEAWDWAAPGEDGLPDKVSDFAVLHLADTRFLRPIELVSARVGTPVRLVGQGNTSTGQPAPVLQQLDGAHVVAPAECADLLISDGEICVRPADRTNLTRGDGGSPALLRQGHGVLALAGTASRTGCTCTERLVSVYTDPADPANREEIIELLTETPPQHTRRGPITGARPDLWATITHP